MLSLRSPITLGAGFLEKVYQRALFRELGLRGIPATAEASFPLVYKGHCVGEYFADILVEDALVVEHGISEAVQFFHIDALSSMVGMKVDFDMQLTLAASSLYRMMAQRIGREYSHSQAKTVFRNLLDLSGKVEVTATAVVVTIDKRAHNPYLVASGLADQPTPMPWFGDKKLIIQFA